MIVVLACIGIVVIFYGEAKESGRNPILWGILGLLSFLVSMFLPMYFLIEYAIGHRTDTIGVLLILGVVFTFIYIGSITCHKVYNYMKRKPSG